MTDPHVPERRHDVALRALVERVLAEADQPAPTEPVAEQPLWMPTLPPRDSAQRPVRRGGVPHRRTLRRQVGVRLGVGCTR